MRSRLLTLCVPLLVLASYGCFSDEPDTAGQATPPPDIDLPGVGEPNACFYRVDTDQDDDGVADILEDRNRNCIVDEGETDPMNPDSDGDGLLDGDEDVDGNGVWDHQRGELHPLRADTDGNGILDGDEPRSLVCNRAHYQAIRGERMLLSSTTTFYAHPDIAYAAPVGKGSSVYLHGDVAGQHGWIVRVRDNDQTLNDLVRTLVYTLPVASAPQVIGMRWVPSLHQDVAHLRFQATPEALTRFIQMLAGLDTAIESPFAAEDISALAQNALVQFVLLEDEGGRRLSVAIAPESGADSWLSVVHPRLIAPMPTDVVRLMCEDVARESQNTLDIYVSAESDVSGAVLAQWEDALRMVAEYRAFQGLQTRVFGYALDAPSGELVWQAVPQAQWSSGAWITARATSDFEGFVQHVAGAQDAMHALEEELTDRAFFILAGAGVEESEELPLALADRSNISTVIISTSPEGVACDTSLSSLRWRAIQYVAKVDEAYWVSTCGPGLASTGARKILAPLWGVAWSGGSYPPIWHTMMLAAGDESIPAEMTTIGDRQAVFANGAVEGERSAISYGVWVPASTMVESP